MSERYVDPHRRRQCRAAPVPARAARARVRRRTRRSSRRRTARRRSSSRSRTGPASACSTSRCRSLSGVKAARADLARLSRGAHHLLDPVPARDLHQRDSQDRQVGPAAARLRLHRQEQPRVALPALRRRRARRRRRHDRPGLQGLVQAAAADRVRGRGALLPRARALELGDRAQVQLSACAASRAGWRRSTRSSSRRPPKARRTRPTTSSPTTSARGRSSRRCGAG